MGRHYKQHHYGTGGAIPMRTNSRGFTLIEVVMALFILSLVLSSTLFAVHQYADERLRIRDRILANQVAWNHLMDSYQYSQKLASRSPGDSLKTKGVDTQGGQDWRWEIKVEKAMGQDLYRHEVQVSLEGSDNFQSSLAVYLVGK
ncbi:MAG: type II secretion system protein GspI [Porticoccaceae bacterium]|jgi:type II secretion system protein I|nr:type II secretion system protein GspI [Porticoccaceae bacterium]